MKQLVYMRDSQKHLKFLCAALKCDTTKFQFYSEKKYDINGQNRVGFTALHHAVYVDSYRMVRALVWMPRINFNVQDLLGNTALHYAAYWSSPFVLQLLLNYDQAAPLIKNEEGQTALDLAKLSQDATKICMLESYEKRYMKICNSKSY